MPADALTVAITVVRDGVRALDVDLRFEPGITCVVGPSGAGKSTLLGAIAGLVQPTTGRITLGARSWFDGRRSEPIHQRRVAYVFQRLALFPHLTGVGNVAYGMDRALPRRDRADRARHLLDRVGVIHLSHRRPATYSGGEAQRVALARALAMAPRVVLLDEPFSALDRALKIQLAGLVRGLVDELGVPLVYVTHSTGEARALADRAVRLEHGVVVAAGAVEDVLGHRGPPHGEDVRAGELVRDPDNEDDDDGGDDDGGDDGDGGPPGPRGPVRRPPDLEGTPMPELIRRRP